MTLSKLTLFCINLISLCCYGQFEGPIDVQRAFNTTIDVPSSTFITTHTFFVTANDENSVALYNVSINFQDGECVNPLVIMEIEPIDYNDGSDEVIYVFYDIFNTNESQIARCDSGVVDSEECGAFVPCFDFQPPSGSYSELLFFIGTADGVGAFCGDSPEEGGDERSFNARFMVNCEVDIESLCPSGGGGGCGSSSEESGDDAVRELGHILEEDHDLEDDEEAKEEVVTFKFDDTTSNNLWIMFVLSVGVCLAQCGFIFCMLYKRK